MEAKKCITPPIMHGTKQKGFYHQEICLSNQIISQILNLLSRNHQFESHKPHGHWRFTWSLTSGPVSRGEGIYKAEVGCSPGKKINHACTGRMGFWTSGGLGAGNWGEIWKETDREFFSSPISSEKISIQLLLIIFT